MESIQAFQKLPFKMNERTTKNLLITKSGHIYLSDDSTLYFSKDGESFTTVALQGTRYNLGSPAIHPDLRDKEPSLEEIEGSSDRVNTIGTINAIVEDSKGRIYIAHGSGIAATAESGGQFKDFVFSDNIKGGMPSPQMIKDLVVTSDDQFIAIGLGLIKGEVTQKNSTLDLVTKTTWNFGYDHLYIGPQDQVYAYDTFLETEEVLLKFDFEKNKFEPFVIRQRPKDKVDATATTGVKYYAGLVHSMYQDSKGAVYLTAGGIVFVGDESAKSFDVFSSYHGNFPETSIKQIALFGEKHFILTTSKSVVLTSKDFKQLRTLGENEGLASATLKHSAVHPNG
ncbi:MAG: hypothetical protein HRT45_19960, partial [Bdellovibrionales bacterium]|nr:hypothetical protein [Bdellovibrionales bacterium]